MQESTVDHLLEVAEDEGRTASKAERYSGRGMGGRTTHGIVVHSQVEFTIIAALAAAEIAKSDPDELIDFIDDLEDYKVDNLGRDLIIY